jgi:hypothetical protein
MVPIPVGMKYSATARGEVPKLVKCEGCGLEYVYLLRARGEGNASSMLFLDNQGAQLRARERAEKQLAAALETGVGVVPCPGCGRIQENMVPLAQKGRHPWMLLLAIFAFLGAALMLVPAACIFSTAPSRTPEEWRGAVWLLADLGLALVGGILLLVRARLSRRYDPNSEPLEERKRWGQEAAWTKEEYLKAVEDAQQGQGE